MTYIGVSPSNGVRRVHTYTATGSQTTFTGASSEGITLSYTDANFMDVYQNGVLLAPADYTATSGTSVVLAEGAAASDIVTITVYDAFSVADTVSKSAGGTFDGNVAMAGTLGVTGVLTGTSLDISGDIDIDGTANLDVTDIDGTLNVAGETTLQTHLNLGDNDKIKLGASGDLEIYHSGSGSYISDTGTGYLFMQGAAQIRLQNPSGSNYAIFTDGGASTLYHNNSAKIATSSTGVTVTGNLLNSAATQGNAFAANTSSTWNALEIFQDRGVANSASGIAFRSQSGTAPAGIVSVALNTTGGREELAFLTSTGNVTSERMRINESGNLGLGTSSPSVPSGTALEIYGSSASRLKLSNSTTGTGATDGFQIYTSGSSAILEQKENAEMRFYTNATERMRIHNGGDITIGGTEIGNAATISLNVGNPGNTSGGLQLWNTTSASHSVQFGDESGTAANHYRGYMEYHHNGDSLRFGTQATERMRITDNGSVVIGVTATDAKLEVKHNVNATSTIIAGAQLMSANNYHDLVLGHGVDYAVGIRRLLQQGTPSYLRPRMDFFVQNYNTYLPADRVVRMTILDTGQILCNTTASLGNGTLHVDASSNIYSIISRANASNGAFILFQKDDGSTIGNIDHTASATRYVTSSDYRLKENVSYNFDATSRLKQLKPARFNFIADETDTLVDGFLAHEVSSIVPEAIRGEKDAVDEDGNIDPQGIDQSKLVPLLVKAMQEQQATIEALTARITTLEGE